MVFKSIILIYLMVYKFLTAEPFCKKESITPIADPTTLPKLPSEFQARVQATFNSEKTVEFFLAYDFYDKKAEIITQEEVEHDRRVFYYDKNEYFSISNYRKCQVKKINESFNEFNFFGLVYSPDGSINMKPVNDLLHFNNEFPHMYVGREVYRGIPVDHYRSCQDWTELNSNFLIDYYFSANEFEQSVGFADLNIQVPVAAIVKGYIDFSAKNAKSNNIENTYEFFEFRPFVNRKSDFYVQPEGIFCHNQTFKEEMPPIPKYFSFTEEILINEKKIAKTNKIYYSYDLKTIRYDTLATEKYRLNVPLKKIHDFNSGVGYIIDEFMGNCSVSPLDDDQDSISLANSAGMALTMKDPKQFFHIDDTYFYAGQRLERAITCDVFVSKRTDFKGMVDKQPEYWVFEIYFMAIGQVMESSESEHPGAPIALKITSSDANTKYVINIYNFDPVEQSMETFDVSQCYKNKEKTQFAISFDLPLDVDKTSFKQNFERHVKKKFYEPMLSALSIYDISPLRIIPPEIRASDSGFVIYTGLTNYAPPINHFRRLISVKIDIQHAVNKIESYSPENCAYQCLKESNLNYYRCLSFDLCLNTDSVSKSATFVCSFYNSSFLTDPSLIIEDGTLCDHYSKNVITFDSVNKEDAFRVVENQVLKGFFNIDCENDGSLKSFKANDIYPATLDASTDSIGKPPEGSTSFFQKFRLTNQSYDLNLDMIKQNNSIQFRQRKGVSIDECARLCSKELTFRCDILTFEPILRECKWSSMSIDFFLDINDNKYLIEKDGYFFYQRDIISLFVEFPFKTATKGDLVEYIVKNEEECAFGCNQEKKFKCRSFNLCDNPRDEKFKYRCLLSDKHTHDDEKNPDLIYSPSCKHFSRESIDDFKLVAGYQLNVKPEIKYTNTSVERCASVCSYMEAFVCRSFDFLIDSNACWLFKENVKDNIHSDVELISNKNSNHYSREYLTENGINLEIDAISKNQKKYQTVTLVSVGIVSLVIGSISSIVIIWFGMKIIRKRKDLPVISYSNPNSKI